MVVAIPWPRRVPKTRLWSASISRVPGQEWQTVVPGHPRRQPTSVWVACPLEAIDPATYVAVSVVLTTAAALASYVPAHRATAVDPVDALRAE